MNGANIRDEYKEDQGIIHSTLGFNTNNMRAFTPKTKTGQEEYIQLYISILPLNQQEKGMRVSRYPHSTLMLTIMPQIPMNKGI